MNRLFFSNLLPGTVLFNRFRLVRCLSATDDGGVFHCHDELNNKAEIALKILSTGCTNSKRAATQLFREMQLSLGIEHPNVLAAREFFRDNDFIAFTMEYVPSGSLAERLSQPKPQQPAEIVKLLMQLCRGLEVIHKAGVVHCDLKPENILVSPESMVKIADFGIARYYPEEEWLEGRGLAGTIDYLSPEQILEGHVSPASDIYSLGVIAYQLLTGKLPFGQNSLVEALATKVCFDPRPPHELTECNRGLSGLVMRAMDRSPNARIGSAHDLLTELKALDIASSVGKLAAA